MFLALDMASPGNQHCASSIDRLLFPMEKPKRRERVSAVSHAWYQLGVHVTGLPGCAAACNDDRTFLGLVCASEQFTELCHV